MLLRRLRVGIFFASFFPFRITTTACGRLWRCASTCAEHRQRADQKKHVPHSTQRHHHFHDSLSLPLVDLDYCTSLTLRVGFAAGFAAGFAVGGIDDEGGGGGGGGVIPIREKHVMCAIGVGENEKPENVSRGQGPWLFQGW